MTTVLSPTEFDHLVQVVHHKALGHRAECWCGWASAWCDDYATADEAANDHREVARMPASDLDATLSGLLDLQDDLADTVMWLAENWSSDLPVPYPYPRADYRDNGDCVPCLVLLVYCGTADRLAEMADLLAGPVVFDPKPSRSGQRFEVVTRTFGRVSIEAFAVAEPTEP